MSNNVYESRSYKAGQALRGFLLPSTTDTYKNLKHKYDHEFKSTIAELDSDVEILQQLYEGSRIKRQNILQRIKSQYPNDSGSDSKSEMEKSSGSIQQVKRNAIIDYDESLLEEYVSGVEMTKKLRKHLIDVSEDAKQFKSYVETQALAEYTHYRGLREWAQRIFPAVDYLATSLLALSTVGAGLVYSTIFGATRGDIGLMSFTFPLFTIGFLIPAVVQIVLRWASNLSKEVPFASQAFWKAVIIVFMFFATLSVIAAITILNATIFLLKPALPSSADAGDGTSDSLSELPGIIAFAFSGTIFLLFFLCIVLSMLVRGPKEIMRLLLQSHGETLHLKNYPHV